MAEAGQWSREPLFVQTTLSPLRTLSSEGKKPSSPMEMVQVLGTTDVPVPGVPLASGPFTASGTGQAFTAVHPRGTSHGVGNSLQAPLCGSLAGWIT